MILQFPKRTKLDIAIDMAVLSEGIRHSAMLVAKTVAPKTGGIRAWYGEEELVEADG